MDTSNLKRNINKTKKYDKYFKGTCKTTFLGNGNTDLSIDIMASWVEKFKYQVKELAFSQFKDQPINILVTNTYNFLHDNVQYQIDGNDQKIRSPYCSWNERFTGVDCKSYTVFASCILSVLGVKHYLRKVKQPSFSPDQYTHVYVVVPVDQKSLKLDKYYIIDPTIHKNSEVAYIGKPKDKLMENVGLPHYGLGYGSVNNEPNNQMQKTLVDSVNKFKRLLVTMEDNGHINRNQSNQALKRLEETISKGEIPNIKNLLPNVNYGLSGEGDETNGSDFAEIFKDIDFSSIGNIFSGIACFGGTAYSTFFVEADKTNIAGILVNLIKNINANAFSGNMAGLTQAVADYNGYATIIEHATNVKIASKSWNVCSSQNLASTLVLAKRLRHIGGKALNVWLNEYYNVQETNLTQAYSSNLIGGLFVGYHAPPLNITVSKNNYTRKDPTKEVKVFAYNDFLVGLTNDQQVTNSNFLNSLQDTLLNASSPSNTPTNTSGNLPTQDEPKVKQAGSTILGVVLVSGLLYAGYEKFIKKEKNAVSSKK